MTKPPPPPPPSLGANASAAVGATKVFQGRKEKRGSKGEFLTSGHVVSHRFVQKVCRGGTGGGRKKTPGGMEAVSVAPSDLHRHWDPPARRGPTGLAGPKTPPRSPGGARARSPVFGAGVGQEGNRKAVVPDDMEGVRRCSGGPPTRCRR